MVEDQARKIGMAKKLSPLDKSACKNPLVRATIPCIIFKVALEIEYCYYLHTYLRMKFFIIPIFLLLVIEYSC
jgi:hypothetical protein